MRGGVKVYRGAAAGARAYLEADRSRADDYYLTEGTGLAQRFSIDHDGHVAALPDLSGEAYEAWVAGLDPDTGQPKGRLRHDDAAVRFVEVVINGPKTWSIAAEIHPDLATSYEAAQDQAVTDVLSWLGQHATTRVGPRGAQVAVPITELEAVAIRHYTSRAGDPHRHIHLQLNARVSSAGKWRGIDTVAIRDSISAIHGIAHAAILTNPQFRATLAAHGFTLTPDGEIDQLTRYGPAFSRRAQQIIAHVERYEHDWKQLNPATEAGPALRRAWDARAWAEARPNKNTAIPADLAHHRWLTELHTLGYQPPNAPAPLQSPPIATLDRGRAAAEIVARLGAQRSAWNHADIRGEAEHHLARTGIITDPAIRTELAEDLTARALHACLPILDRAGVPDHIRALTSPAVLEIETDLTERLAIRGATTGHDADVPAAALAKLDDAQLRAVRAVAGDHALVVIEGAAGSGKTTMLATVRDTLAEQGRLMTVVTPTLKAAKVASGQLGTKAGSAAWLAHQHGWRWDASGTWTRLASGNVDPTTGHTYAGPMPPAQLRADDLLVIDEAGMLDQDTARALLVIADEHRLRVALVGDRYQLAAVGRGGVLMIAERWCEQLHTLDVIHRFTRIITIDGDTASVPDDDYADLTLRLRSGLDPGDVFDELRRRGQVVIHSNDADRRDEIAARAVTDLRTDRAAVVVADTREHVRELNDDIRARRVQVGEVDDLDVFETASGERIGVGDVIATRRNDRTTGVANRDTWTVTAVDASGTVHIRGEHGDRVLGAAYAREFTELAYASTAHGVQGETAVAGTLLLSEHTSAASAYVGLTRGREDNTVHLVAGGVADAREQWIAACARDRADLGLSTARASASQTASQYAEPRPLDEVLIQLRAAWTLAADTRVQLDRRRTLLQQQDAADELDAKSIPAGRRLHEAASRLTALTSQLRQAQARIETAAETAHIRTRGTWNRDRRTAHRAAATLAAGPGRFGQRRAEVETAKEWLRNWADSWSAIVPAIADHPGGPIGFAAQPPHIDQLRLALQDFAQIQARALHPEHAALVAAVEAADHERDAAVATVNEISAARSQISIRRVRRGADDVPGLEANHAEALAKVAALQADPVILAQPPGYLELVRDQWRAQLAAERAASSRTDNALRAPTTDEETVRRQQQLRLLREQRGPSVGL